MSNLSAFLAKARGPAPGSTGIVPPHMQQRPAPFQMPGQPMPTRPVPPPQMSGPGAVTPVPTTPVPPPQMPQMPQMPQTPQMPQMPQMRQPGNTGIVPPHMRQRPNLAMIEPIRRARGMGGARNKFRMGFV